MACARPSATGGTPRSSVTPAASTARRERDVPNALVQLRAGLRSGRSSRCLLTHPRPVAVDGVPGVGVMRRLFWLAMGITIGALIVRKLSKAAAKLTPSGVAKGLSASLADLADSIRDFTVDVRAAMTEREAQLRES